MRIREVVAKCPKCKTFETLWFKGNALVPTLKFRQNGGGEVYHDCGCQWPCVLFPTFKGEAIMRSRGQK